MDEIGYGIIELDRIGEFTIKKRNQRYKVTIISSGAGFKHESLAEAINGCLGVHKKRTMTRSRR